MLIRTTLAAAITAVVLLTTSGCAVMIIGKLLRNLNRNNNFRI